MTELRLAQRAIADLRTPKPHVYFVDLALTAAATFAGVLISMRAFLPGTLLAGLALSRAVLFAHELSHQRSAIPGLRLVWHVAIGVPFLFPSFLYEAVHRRHHHVAVYRTAHDPEHAPDERSFFARTLTAMLAALALPFLLLVRWLLVPFTPWSPGLRAFVLRRFSSLTLNGQYVPPRHRGRSELAAEVACALWAYAIVLGVLPWPVVASGALAISIAAAISHLRGEVLHRFQANGETGTLERQVLDSVNLASTSLVARLLFPMGIGYHALHHLAPSLPYHAIRVAHDRLLAFPFYATATTPGIWPAIVRRRHAQNAPRVESFGERPRPTVGGDGERVVARRTADRSLLRRSGRHCRLDHLDAERLDDGTAHDAARFASRVPAS